MATVTKIAPNGQPPAGTIHWFNECVARSRAAGFAEIVTVTPGLAGHILSRNDDNRNFKPVKAQHYAEDMIAGRWTFNFEPVIIAETGELNDGQHRMQAVIDANVCVPFLMAFGASRESRKTIDQGAARTAADYLSMDGVANATTAAGVARLVMAYEHTDRRGISCAKDYTNAQITTRVHADPAIGDSAKYAHGVSRFTKGMLNPSLVGAAHYFFSEISPADAIEYLDQVCIGENIKRGDPAFAVRGALASYERTGKAPRLEMVMRGWNAFRQGRKLTIAKTLGQFPALI